MKSIRLLIISSLMVVAFGCSTVSYQYDYNLDANFTGLKTFKWMDVSIDEGFHALNTKRIQQSVNAQLATKGCKVTADSPDFLVSMHLAKEEKTDIRAFNYTYGIRTVYGAAHEDTSQLNVYQYEEGTFVLDFVDAQSRELIWRGIAQGEVRNYSNPVKRNERINEVVRNVLSNFPPVK